VERESGADGGDSEAADWERYRLEARPSRRRPRPSEQRGIALVVISAIVTVVVGLSGMVAIAGAVTKVSPGDMVQRSLGKPASAAKHSNTPTPNPNPMLNQRQGCAAGPPKPIAYAIHGGSYKGKGTAPNEVALTFDDGPSTYSSLPIIEYLEKTHTPATFFVEGQYARLWPNLLHREWLDGFAIGMHSWNHPDMTQLSYQEREHQLSDTKKAIQNVLGKDACLWFWRPPYGDLNTSVFNQATAHGFTTIDWNDDSRDWTRPGVRAIVNTVLSEATRGSIILFHDGPALREQTAAALPLVLAGLKQRGLKPVAIPQLLADSGYPGVHLTNNVTGTAWQIGEPPAPYKAALLRLQGQAASSSAPTQAVLADFGGIAPVSQDASPRKQEE
jgi:peptidoglycan/xylan/chitin deacetylase (PgdA/CDA1 family)